MFFYFKGDGEDSWSVRDYSSGGAPSLRYARDFGGMSARDVLGRAEIKVPAEAHPTTDIAWYVDQTRRLNRQHLGGEGPPPDQEPATDTSPVERPTFPVLDAEVLQSLPKASKTQDMERILHSPRSEDWMTWTVLRGLQRSPRWWPDLLALAESTSEVPTGLSVHDVPVIKPWVTVPSPPDYEAASRQRMAASGDSRRVGRSQNPKAVEGDTEVDVILDGNQQVVFVEAKLDADISFNTTWDPERNQILRNIDCLIEVADGRVPRFWMFVADRGSGHAYAQLLDGYRRNPTEIRRLLPHREPADLDEILQATVLLTWRELAELLPPDLDPDVVTELWRRIGAGD